MRSSDYLICPHCGTRAKTIKALFGKSDLYGQLGRSVETCEGLTTCQGCKNPVTILKKVVITLKVKNIKEPPPIDPETYHMTLRSVGNPDFAQYAPVSPKEEVFGKTLLEMRTHLENYIRVWELGGGNLVDPIVTRGGKLVGRFSYNGRLWEGRKYTETAKEIEIDSWEAGIKLGRKEREKKTK